MKTTHGSVVFTASNGEEYEIRHTSTPSRVEMRVFKGNLRANRFCYTSSYEIADEFTFTTGGNVIDELIRKAKSDVEHDIRLN
jgi:hypothetical protein